MFDISTFQPDETCASKFGQYGTMIMTLGDVRKRIGVFVTRNLSSFEGNQPFVQTHFKQNELECVYEDGTVDKAEYMEYVGSDPRFSSRYNMLYAKQKKIVKYRFRS
jgi:hypothetical protein